MIFKNKILGYVQVQYNISGREKLLYFTLVILAKRMHSFEVIFLYQVCIPFISILPNIDKVYNITLYRVNSQYDYTVSITM